MIYIENIGKRVNGLKLKYKKLVLVISVGTICIGGIAFSIVNYNTGNKEKKDSGRQEVVVTDDNFTSATFDTHEGNIVLEKNAYPEINNLVKEYLDAEVKCDMDKLGTLVSTIELVNEPNLKLLNKYAEGYENVDCYTVKGKEKDSFVIMVKSELKFKNVETLAPGLNGLYANKDSNGNWVIVTSPLSPENRGYQETVYNSEGAKQLINETETAYQEAIKKDKELSSIYNKMQEEASAGMPSNAPDTNPEKETK